MKLKAVLTTQEAEKHSCFFAVTCVLYCIKTIFFSFTIYILIVQNALELFLYDGNCMKYLAPATQRTVSTWSISEVLFTLCSHYLWYEFYDQWLCLPGEVFSGRIFCSVKSVKPLLSFCTFQQNLPKG